VSSPLRRGTGSPTRPSRTPPRYDAAIRPVVSRDATSSCRTYWVTAWEKEMDLSYGENPHQRAALYVEPRGAAPHVLSMVSKLHGKPLSFNNVLDLNSGALSAGRPGRGLGA